jgi:hypothetical protein
VDELVKYMGWLCNELQGKLRRQDIQEKRKYDRDITTVLELERGDEVLVKNR